MVGKAFAERVYTTVPVANNFQAPVRMLIPPNYDDGYPHPAIVDVYGGPDSQEVNHRFAKGSWPDYLSTNYGIVYISIDGRGTGLQVLN